MGRRQARASWVAPDLSSPLAPNRQRKPVHPDHVSVAPNPFPSRISLTPAPMHGPAVLISPHLYAGSSFFCDLYPCLCFPASFCFPPLLEFSFPVAYAHFPPTPRSLIHKPSITVSSSPPRFLSSFPSESFPILPTSPILSPKGPGPSPHIYLAQLRPGSFCPNPATSCGPLPGAPLIPCVFGVHITRQLPALGAPTVKEDQTFSPDLRLVRLRQCLFTV